MPGLAGVRPFIGQEPKHRRYVENVLALDRNDSASLPRGGQLFRARTMDDVSGQPGSHRINY